MSENVLELKNVTYTYGSNNSPTLKGLNLCVRKGEVVAIYGHNGSGKTTLFNLITNKLSGAFSGEILINGDMLNKDLVYKKISYFKQKREDEHVEAFFVKNELLNIDKISFERVKEIAQYFRCESLLKKRMASLSGGQKQLVYIMKAFLKGGDLILLDEPTNNLDGEKVILLSNYIKDYIKENPQKAIVIVTHCKMFPNVTAYNLQKGELVKLSEKESCNSCFGIPNDEGYYNVGDYEEPNENIKTGFFQKIINLFKA